MPMRPHDATATAAAVASLLLLPLATPAAARTAAEPATYTLRNTNTGTCLHHIFGTTQVRLEPCEAVPEQRWELWPEGASLNVAVFDPEKNTRGCVAIGDSWSIRYGQCRTTEAAWSVADGPHSRVRSASGLNDNDLYLTETRSGHLGATPGGTTPSASWIVTEVP
ncbi:hypothetical protein ACIRYZ_39940 [Kitasatospora sp. NPDC101155]|uniref:hypothetical protein n=1 Tax=Kitasatospora sp. NPDC101155 TaxID=3364097 RepID=UPI0037F37789